MCLTPPFLNAMLLLCLGDGTCAASEASRDGRAVEVVVANGGGEELTAPHAILGASISSV
jgi:hypothetical protein